MARAKAVPKMVNFMFAVGICFGGVGKRLFQVR